MKIILILLSLVLIWWIIVTLKRSSTPSVRSAKGQQKMVGCAYCKLHVPEDEAVRHCGRDYCCSEHARLDDHDD